MTALFLKYRPQTFADIVGQESIKKTLQNALKQDKPSHAYMFSGSRGTGKTSTARIFAKGLNCQNLKEGDPCGTCDFCIKTMNGELIDVIEIDAASNRGIDEIRDLREKIIFAPNLAKRKIYIIDEVHMLSKEAFNALLKTLEEPPDHAYFCLATTEIHKIPETILSRCQVFLFGRFNLDQLITRLEKIAKSENFKYETKALKLIAQKAEGGLRDAISLLEQVSAESEGDITEAKIKESLGISSTELLENFYQALANKQTTKAFEVIRSINQVGGDFRSFGHDFLNFSREKMFLSLEDNTQLPQIIKIINEIEKALIRLKTTPIIELPLEIAIINIIKDDVTTLNIANISTKDPNYSGKSEQAKARKQSESNPLISTKEKPADSTEDIIFTESKIEKTIKEVETLSESKIPHNIDFSENISQMDIESSLKKIAEKAGIPIFAKRSFTTTVPKINGNKITFYTDSNFHREKLASSNVLVPIKKAIAEIFNGNFIVDIVLDENLKKKRAINTPPPKQAQSIGTAGIASADDFLTF